MNKSIVLQFPATMVEAFDAVGASYAASVRKITYYLYEEAREVHESQMHDVKDDFGVKINPHIRVSLVHSYWTH